MPVLACFIRGKIGIYILITDHKSQKMQNNKKIVPGWTRHAPSRYMPRGSARCMRVAEPDLDNSVGKPFGEGRPDMPPLELGIWDLEFEIWNLEPGTWN